MAVDGGTIRGVRTTLHIHRSGISVRSCGTSLLVEHLSLRSGRAKRMATTGGADP